MSEKFLFLFLIAVVCTEIVYALSFGRHGVKETSVPLSPYSVRNFDYDYEMAQRGLTFNAYPYRQKSNSPTQRPLISYWQNIMRNVRLPVPSITWNMTNPLMNLFNMGDEQPLHIPPDEDNYELISNTKRRNKKRKRKNSNRKRHRKNKHPIEDDDQLGEEEQILLQQFSNTVQPNDAMYFYNPNSDSYYSVQRVRALGSYIGGFKLRSPVSDEAPKKDNEEQTSITKSVKNEVLNSADKPQIPIDEQDAEKDINLDEMDETDSELSPPQKISDYNEQENPKNQFENEESLRRVMGTYMVEDHFNRHQQRTKDEHRVNSPSKHKARNNLRYYFLIKND